MIVRPPVYCREYPFSRSHLCELPGLSDELGRFFINFLIRAVDIYPKDGAQASVHDADGFLPRCDLVFDVRRIKGQDLIAASRHGHHSNL